MKIVNTQLGYLDRTFYLNYSNVLFQCTPIVDED